MERLTIRTATKKIAVNKEIYLVLIILIISIAISLMNSRFFSLENLFDILRSYSFLGILAIGTLVVLLSGGIDISIASTATVAQYVMAVFMQKHPEINIAVALLIPLVVGIALGSVNAALIYFLDAPPIIVTISTMNVFFGVLQFVSGGKWIVTFPDWFYRLATMKVLALQNQDGITYGLSLLTVIWFGIAILTFIVLRYTVTGRKVSALGGNREAAKRAGLNIFSLQLYVYCFMGFLSGLASIMQALMSLTVAPNALIGRELEVIAAVVLGGASLAGGYGTIAGTLLGVALMAVIGNGLVLMKISTFWHKTLIGIIILASVSLTALQQQSFRRKTSKIDVE